MKNVIKLFGIIALVTVIGFSMTSCGSSPSNSSNKPVTTILEEVTIDLDSDDGKKLLHQAVNTYTSKYSYYDMDIEIGIQELVDGNYAGYTNKFKISKAVNKDFTYYCIAAQHNVMCVLIFFSDEPFKDGVSTRVSWEYNKQYSTGQREEEQAKRLTKEKWDRFFESKYNEALLKLSIEERKVPEDNAKLKFNIIQARFELEMHKMVHALWFSSEKLL